MECPLEGQPGKIGHLFVQGQPLIGERLGRIERRHERSGSRLLNHHVAGRVRRDLNTIGKLLDLRSAPRSHEEILAFVTRLRSEYPSDVHLSQDRESLASEGEPGADDRLVITFGNVDRVAVVGHLPYGNPSMTLLSIPNVSEGARPEVVDGLAERVRATAGRVLDIHRDPVHNRSVLTCTADPEGLIDSMTTLALEAALVINLSDHRGVHPTLGALDVCPVVPHGESIETAIDIAGALADSIGNAGLPVYLYGDAAERAATRELPDIRRGGIEGLIERSRSGLPPDRGPGKIDPARGIVCVGARGPLIAFNVWLAADVSTARAIARQIRTASGGPPGVRALGLRMDEGSSQVSMNLTRPDRTGIDIAFALVERAAQALGASVQATEIVGLVEEIYLPNPDATAARLLIEPGRTVESLLT